MPSGVAASKLCPLEGKPILTVPPAEEEAEALLPEDAASASAPAPHPESQHHGTGSHALEGLSARECPLCCMHIASQHLLSFRRQG
ncbi:hypothetical protein [Atopobium sp. oral taxon 416]|uniref:hypothetical protein n=1 Tax=Atopobium sp. oral taxon 416 TaxID=712157 RepID=UPI001BA73A62|nr:hypothetical protein [Atopobium sp. oral taxon 416]QUC04168.1 hypothetical protein J4859_04300 [Atopobium sp. oral taxon 416]